MVELSQISGLFSINLLDRRKIVCDLIIECAIETNPHEEHGACREETDDDRKDRGVPQAESRADARHSSPQPRSRRSTKPTPRTV